jgi:hypothetical protein
MHQPPALLTSVILLLIHALHTDSLATCQLEVRASSTGLSISSASLRCSGGNVTAAFDPHWLGKHKAKFTGVTWDRDNCGEPGCMLMFCGSTKATFTKLVVRGVQHMFDMGVLCIAGESIVSMSGADISYNVGSGGLAV